MEEIVAGKVVNMDKVGLYVLGKDVSTKKASLGGEIQ
jgi:hypothetical protein